MRPFSGPESVNSAGRLGPPLLFQGFITLQIREDSFRAWRAAQSFWGVISDLAQADLLLQSRVWGTDDEGHGRIHTAPVHR